MGMKVWYSETRKDCKISERSLVFTPKQKL